MLHTNTDGCTAAFFSWSPRADGDSRKDCCTAKHSHQYNKQGPANKGVTQSRIKETERTCINTCTGPRPSPEPACETHLVPPQTWTPNRGVQGTPPTCPKMTLQAAPSQSRDSRTRFPPYDDGPRHDVPDLGAGARDRGRRLGHAWPTGASAARSVARRQRVQTSGTCGGTPLSSAATTNRAEFQASPMHY